MKTPRKQQPVADNCNLLADVVLQSRDAITVQSLDGAIMAWNKGAENMYGYSEADALKMNISAIIPKDKHQEMNELLENIKTGKKIESLQTKRVTRGGRFIDVWMTFTKLVDNENNITGLATIERDVTEHNKLLEDIESSFALAEEYTKDIERLVAERTTSLIALNIADRIINPSVVIGMMCKKMLARDHPSDERAYLEIMREESEKLQQIVTEFGYLLEKKMSIFSYEDFNGILKEAIELIRKEADLKGIDLIADLSKTPLMINMDRNVLRTAILYIYKNALEATQGGGRITTSSAENSDSISVIISDTGCGIADENISRVFDNFFTTKLNAVGMGLPFVKHIINEHFGDIHIESQTGIGTSCTMRFPVRWLKMSDGKLTWERPMLPAVKETREYPLQVDTGASMPREDEPD